MSDLDRGLHGLQLTKSERLIIVTLSYIYFTPIVYSKCQQLFSWVRNIFDQREAARAARVRDHLEDYRRMRGE